MSNWKFPRDSRWQTGLLIALAGLMPLVGCTQQPVAEVAPSPSPSLVPIPSPTIPAPSPAASPTPQLQTFREKTGLFQISFPKGYTHKATASGVAFVSKDQGFAGSVDYGSAEGKQLSSQQLEASLKAEMSNRLQQVNWQTTQPQPDGSLRIDWTGKDKTGNALDAVSIVEQRGNTIFVLNLFGINKPYQGYNIDAETIVNNYKLQPGQASPAASPGASPSASPSPVASPSSSPSPATSPRP